jgi:hypothetical protein
VPQALLDWQLGDAARHFRGCRPPVWCWGTSQGAALVRMADIDPTITERWVVRTLHSLNDNVVMKKYILKPSHPKNQFAAVDLALCEGTLYN